MINLLPQETVLASKEGKKLKLINTISLVSFILLIFFTTITLTMRILQNVQYSNATTRLVQAQEQVSNLKDREGYVALLKQKLTTIQKLGYDSKKTALANLVMTLVPSDVTLNLVTVDKSGILTLSASTPSQVTIEKLIADLSNKEKNANLVDSLFMDTMTIGKDNIIRFSLRVTPTKS